MRFFFSSQEKRKKQREQIVGASSGVNNKLKNALSFLRPNVSFSGGGAGAGANFTTQFKDQAKEIAGGENKKLESEPVSCLQLLRFNEYVFQISKVKVEMQLIIFSMSDFNILIPTITEF